jgi:hypothetical protein
MKNMINWFELPVVDLKRATAFYEQVLATSLKTENFQGTPMAILKVDGVSGALVKVPNRKPSGEGTLIYFNVDGQLDAVLGRVEKAGGKQLGPVVHMGPQGSYAVLQDTEGNQVGVHSSAR